MKEETKEIEIVKWVVRVPETGAAELVGLDKDGNEYRTHHQVYVHGEYHDVENRLVCTSKDD